MTRSSSRLCIKSTSTMITYRKKRKIKPTKPNKKHCLEPKKCLYNYEQNWRPWKWTTILKENDWRWWLMTQVLLRTKQRSFRTSTQKSFKGSLNIWHRIMPDYNKSSRIYSSNKNRKYLLLKWRLKSSQENSWRKKPLNLHLKTSMWRTTTRWTWHYK